MPDTRLVGERITYHCKRLSWVFLVGAGEGGEASRPAWKIGDMTFALPSTNKERGTAAV
jgi:hypothetical protein